MKNENPVLPEYPEIVTIKYAMLVMLAGLGIKLPDAEANEK